MRELTARQADDIYELINERAGRPPTVRTGTGLLPRPTGPWPGKGAGH